MDHQKNKEQDYPFSLSEISKRKSRSPFQPVSIQNFDLGYTVMKTVQKFIITLEKKNLELMHCEMKVRVQLNHARRFPALITSLFDWTTFFSIYRTCISATFFPSD